MYGESKMENFINICKIITNGNLLYVSGNSKGLFFNLEGWYGEEMRREAERERRADSC